MASALVPLPLNKSLHERHLIHEESKSDDEYSIEYYDDYETVDETQNNNDVDQQSKGYLYNKSMSSVSVETVEDDDDDEYTYVEEILEVVVEGNEDNNPTPAPLSSPDFHARNSNNTSSRGMPRQETPPTKVPSSPVTTKGSPTAPKHRLKDPPPLMTSFESSSPVATKVTPTAPRYGLKDPPLGMTPSKQRAKAANSAGLSELSKQLRILQAKNESQHVDINRLERQLRIMADLQGISVGDLRKALEDACASEAFGELQNRVSKLKYELEAATLAKKKEIRQDAAAPHIANLELRVGELEEVEEKQMMEIRDLYDGLRREKARSTQFQAENEKLQLALQDAIKRVESETARGAQAEQNFKKQIQDMRDLQSKILHEEAGRSRGKSSRGVEIEQAKVSAGKRFGTVSPEMAADYERMVQLLQKKDEELLQLQAKLHTNEIRQAEKLKDAEDRSRQTQMGIKVEADKLALTVKELEDADGQNGLRLAQFKARFTVQDERIVDMAQQLDSLYTAFNLLNEEMDSENVKRAAMMNNLQDADAEIARQTKEKEEDAEKAKNSRKRNDNFPSSPAASTHRTVSTPTSAYRTKKATVPSSPGMEDIRPAIVTVVPVVPTTPDTERGLQDMAPYIYNEAPHTPHSTNSFSTLTNDRTYDRYKEASAPYATVQAFHPTPERTPSTWELLSDQEKHDRSGIKGGGYQQVEGQLICGSLIVESNSMLRKWKTRPSRIYLRGEGYQWEIGDKRSFPLQFGVSKVEFHPNYPLSFVVYLDPSSSHAPTIRAATINEYEYHRWMAALFKATSGEEYQGGSHVPQQPPSQLYNRKPPPPSSINSSGIPPSNNERFHHLLSSPISNRKLSSASRNATPTTNRSVSSAPRKEEPQDDELKRVLELSKYEM
mmetsp:Transcript_12087/g.28646  ORF Transcript_12087/g.28646 Transcript_12087/m.28646 type:complete len:894 (-) Transcript_12087:176-2857(-)